MSQRRSICVIALAVIISALSADVRADGYVNGYVSGQYTYNNGYWYIGSQAYTRASVPYVTQVWNGYAYCPKTYYSYAYTPYYAPAAVSYKDPDWRGKLLAIAEQRDRFILNQRKDAIEQNNFVESLRELGLGGNFAVQGYGNAVAYANPYRLVGSYGVNNYGNNGSTVYGYSYSTVADLYGKADTNVLYNQLARSTENAQALSDSAVRQLSDIVKLDGSNRERVAALLAKGQIMSRLAETLETPAARTRTTVTRTQSSADIPPPIPTHPPATNGNVNGNGNGNSNTDYANDLSAVATRFQQAATKVISSRCIVCHGPTNPKGGLDLSNPFQLPAETMVKIIDRVRSPDSAKRMPLGDNGGPGELLTNAELLALMAAFDSSN